MNETGTWTVTPSAGVTFVNVNDPKTKVTGLANNASYTFTWTITNSCGTSSSNVIITTTNTAGPKQAIAGSSQCLSSGTLSLNLGGNAPSVEINANTPNIEEDLGQKVEDGLIDRKKDDADENLDSADEGNDEERKRNLFYQVGGNEYILRPFGCELSLKYEAHLLGRGT